MKQLIYIIAIIFLCDNSFAQAKGDVCIEGTDSARADFSKGILRTYIFGLTNSFAFGKILKERYNVDVVYWGCIVEEKYYCYSKYMDSMLIKKYGKDFFNKIAKEAKQLDSIGKGDRSSSFIGGEQKLMKFIYCNLDLKNANYKKHMKGKVNLKFTIDTTGKPIDIKIMKTSNEDYSKEAIRIMNLMPNWIYATKNGKPIQENWSLPIVFDEVWKNKYEDNNRFHKD